MRLVAENGVPETWDLLILLLLSCTHGITITSQRSTCYVETTSGDVDLQSLAKTDGNPRFSTVLVSGPFNLMILWNPCTEFTIHDETSTDNDCIDVEVCIHIKNGEVVNRYFDPANSTQGAFLVTKEDLIALQYITASETESDKNLTVRIQLICNQNADNNDTLVPSGGDGEENWVLNLTSSHACYVPAPKEPKTGELGAGYIVLITVCATLIISLPAVLIASQYCIRYRRKAPAGSEDGEDIGLLE